MDRCLGTSRGPARSLFLMGASMNIEMNDPPASVVVMGLALACYAVSRILIARRVHHLCTDLMQQKNIEGIRASHTEPVGGG